ncbi:MAG: adenylate/guanylate cyclase domain-containing protein [Bdellovibrionales bacterium]|nr:adenylate/guanylate cyclase domain-containing protein [Bdellovibrionales bacterium]
MESLAALLSPEHQEDLRKRVRRVALTVDLRSLPEELWPYVANTNEANKRTGMAPASYEFVPLPTGGTALVGRTRLGGFPAEYLELPYEWKTPQYLHVERFYSRGIFRYLKFGSQLQETSGGQTRITVFMDYVPRWPLPLKGTMTKQLQAFASHYRAVDARLGARDAAMTHLPGLEPLDAPAGSKDALKLQAAVQALRDRWAPLTADLELPGRIAQYVLQSPELVARRIRPRELALALRRPLPEVLRFLLLATREGFLELRWNVLCPSCKGAKLETEGLGGLESSVHCESCNIDYEAGFDRNVEVSFRPSPRVRAFKDGDFCFGSPSNTSHVWAQFPLRPGERRRISLKLPRGKYRWRSLSAPEDREFAVEPDAAQASDAELTLNGALRLPLPDTLGPAISLTVSNALEAPVTLKLERLKERELALTAHELTTFQDFRDLFASEVLRPGVELGISGVTLLFTDLKDSTAMYERQGDAPAFTLVQEHFDAMFAVLKEEQGAVVKTIGDAVMAAFTHPEAAVRASLKILETFERGNAQAPPERKVLVKIGVHQGACIVIAQNGRLDYFGSTVNRAARIQGAAGSEELVISEAVFFEPMVQKALQNVKDGVRVEKFRAELKGVGDRMHLFRVTLGGFARQSEAA